MLAQKTVISKLKKIADEIKQSGIHLNRVVLYGSYAINKQHKWSDIDVALVADEFKSVGFDDVGLFAATLIKYPTLNISPRTYNTHDFSPERDPFVQVILKTGIEIQ